MIYELQKRNTKI